MLCMLLAYDAADNVVATLDYLTMYDDQGNALGLVDFDEHERSGRPMTEVWTVDGAAGSKAWPEWLGSRAREFRVERTGPAGAKRVTALIHRESGSRRERSTVEAAIQERITQAAGEPADIRDLVGGPDRPIDLDPQGDTAPRAPRVIPPSLPIAGLKPRPENPMTLATEDEPQRKGRTT